MDSQNSWKEYRTPEGKPYYFNPQTNETTWSRPAELGPPPSDDRLNQAWTEYTAADGRKYYHNAISKQTTWDMPEAYRNSLSQAPSLPQQPQSHEQSQLQSSGPPSRTPQPTGGPSAFRPPNRDRDDRHQTHTRSEVFHGSGAPAITNDPEYPSFEEAEAAFMRHLKKCGVQVDWTYKQTIEACATDSQWRSIHDPRLRRAAFDKYVEESKSQEKEREKERLDKLRENFNAMLSTHPEIKHYTRWKTARPMIEAETIFRSTNDENERRQLYKDYIKQAKKDLVEKRIELRKEIPESFLNLLTSMDLEVSTRWAEAESLLEKSERFQKDDKFRALTERQKLDLWEQHVKSLEDQRNWNNAMRDAKKIRQERKNRESFVDLLKELMKAGQVKPGSKWMDVFPSLKDESRFREILGQPGSSPLDFFLDVVDEEEKRVKDKRKHILEILENENFEIQTDSKLDDFLAAVSRDKDSASLTLSKDDLVFLFHYLQERYSRKQEEDRHVNIDALRSKIRRLQPPVRVDDSWERDVRPRVEKTKEFQRVESEDSRRSAFDMVIQRLKERRADDEYSERTRRDDRVDREGSTADSRRPKDPYQSERSKLDADRERRYRNSSNTGLSPSHIGSHAPRRRERDRYDGRQEDIERVHGEREHGHHSRADPREEFKALDYGEGPNPGDHTRGNASGLKRESEGPEGGRKSSKKLKQSGGKDESKSPGELQEEERGFKSGSEEGEIEEE